MSKMVASAESGGRLNEQEVKDAVAGSPQASYIADTASVQVEALEAALLSVGGSTREEKRAKWHAKDEAAKAAMEEYPVAVEVAEVEAGMERARKRRREATLEAAEAVVKKSVPEAVAMARTEMNDIRREQTSAEAAVRVVHQEAAEAVAAGRVGTTGRRRSRRGKDFT